MEITFQILTYVMTFFIAIFVIAGLLSLFGNNNKEKRIGVICKMISAGLVFAISAVRLFIANDLGEELEQYIVLLPTWFFITLLQPYFLKNIKSEK